MILGFEHPYIYAIPDNEGERYALGTMPWAIVQRIGQTFGFRCYWTRVNEIRSIIGDGNISFHQSFGKIKTWYRVDRQLSFIDAEEAKRKISSIFTKSFQPRGYQARGIAWLSSIKRSIIADSAGLGKTIQSTGAIVVRSMNNPNEVRGTTLVVVPKAVKDQWKSEIIAMFRNDADGDILFGNEDVMIYDGTPSFRQSLTRKKPPFWTIVTYAILIREIDKITEWLQRTGGVWATIFDESSVFKNISSKTYHSCFGLMKTFRPTMRFCLNATPIENGVRDLYCQVSMIEPEIFPNYEDFERRHINRIRTEGRNGSVFWKDVGIKNLQEIRRMIRDVYIRREISEVGEELPEVIPITITVEMTPAHKAAYELIDSSEEIDDIVRANALIRAALFYHDLNGALVSPKFEEIIRILTEENGQKAVIASESKVFIEECHRILVEHGFVARMITGDVSGERRKEISNDFVNGGVQVLLGTSAIERGLNLQVASVYINADCPWNPAKIIQRIGRVRRIRASSKVIKSFMLVTEGTLEERAVNTVYRKTGIFDNVFDADPNSAEDEATRSISKIVARKGRRKKKKT